MKRSFKVLGLSLCAALMFLGCGCSKDDNKVTVGVTDGDKNIVDGLSEGVKNVTVQQLFDDLKEQYGNDYAANKLIEIIANKVLSNETWLTRYNKKIDDKLMELVEKKEYADNKGNFDEKRLVMDLQSKLYKITSDDETVYGPVVEDGETINLTWDYSDYINKELRLDVLQELLNEKYIYDEVLENNSNILTSKDARVVEYIAISSEEDDAWEFLNTWSEKLIAGEATLKDIETEWKKKLSQNIIDEFEKIGTSEDGDGSILDDFTNEYAYTKEVGKELKLKEVEDKEYYHDVVITSDSNDILYSTLVERIQSDNVLEDSAYKTVDIHGSRYVVSPLAGSNVSKNDIRITDTENKLYYIIKVDVFDKLEDVQEVEKDSKTYRAVEVLAKNSNLVSDSLNYYLEQYKTDISVHDEEIYNYLSIRFKDIFVD